MHSVALSAIFSAIGICCAQLKARKSCQLSYSAPTPHALICREAAEMRIMVVSTFVLPVILTILGMTSKQIHIS